MSEYYDPELPSSRQHCEVCAFRHLEPTEDEIVLADQRATVLLHVRALCSEVIDHEVDLMVAKEMRLNLPAEDVWAGIQCGTCIFQGLCQDYRKVPDPLDESTVTIVPIIPRAS